MASKDIHSLLEVQHIFASELINIPGDDPGLFIVIDTALLNSIEIAFTSVNEAGDGSFTFQLRDGESDDFATHILVADKDLLGDIMVIDGANQIFNQGYIGKKRFISAAILASGVTLGRRVGAIVVADTPIRAPININ